MKSKAKQKKTWSVLICRKQCDVHRTEKRQKSKCSLRIKINRIIKY